MDFITCNLFYIDNRDQKSTCSNPYAEFRNHTHIFRSREPRKRQVKNMNIILGTFIWVPRKNNYVNAVLEYLAAALDFSIPRIPGIRIAQALVYY
jgi:hypothetical protein